MIATIIVYSTDDTLHYGVEAEYDDAAVQATVDKFLQAEGQGSFVLETKDGWKIFPSRSIVLIELLKQEG